VAGAICAIAGTYVLTARSAMHGPGVALVVAASITAGLLINRVHGEERLLVPWGRLGLAGLLVAPVLLFRFVVPSNSVPSLRLSLVCLCIGGIYLSAVLAQVSGTFTVGRLVRTTLNRATSWRVERAAERQ